MDFFWDWALLETLSLSLIHAMESVSVASNSDPSLICDSSSHWEDQIHTGVLLNHWDQGFLCLFFAIAIVPVIVSPIVIPQWNAANGGGGVKKLSISASSRRSVHQTENCMMCHIESVLHIIGRQSFLSWPSKNEKSTCSCIWSWV